MLPKHQTERWKVNKLINLQWEELKCSKVKTHQSLWIRLDSVLSSAELCMMSSTHPIANRRIYPDDNINLSHNNIHLDYCNEIATIKTALLTPSEVTFHDCEVPRRKRLTTISSETTEGDSHASTSTINAKTKKIPDGGYGWIVSLQVDVWCFFNDTFHIVSRQQRRLQVEMKSIFFIFLSQGRFCIIDGVADCWWNIVFIWIDLHWVTEKLQWRGDEDGDCWCAVYVGATVSIS